MTMTNGFTTAPRIAPYSRAAALLRWVVLMLGLMMVGAAYGVTFNVDIAADGNDANLGDNICEVTPGLRNCSLRAAIQQANANGTSDTIVLGNTTYQLTIPNGGNPDDLAVRGDLDITSAIEIVGGGKGITIINGNGGTTGDRVFHITNNAVVSMRGVTITGGHASNSVGGGIFVQSGSLTLTNSEVSDNSTSNPSEIVNGGNGGGIYNSTSGTVQLETTDVKDNTSDTNNKGIGGGGIFNAGKLTINGGTIDANEAVNSPSAGGGGVLNLGGDGIDPNIAVVTITNTTISRNIADIGGGIRNLYGSVNLERVTINNNSARSAGAGIENAGGSMIIEHSAIRNNTAGTSGGLGNSFAGATGGGIANFAAMSLSHSAVHDNAADNSGFGQGGGIYNGGLGELNLLNTTLTGNTSLEGGGIYNHRAINITNSTIYNNTSNRSASGSEIHTCGTKDESRGQDCSNLSAEVQTRIVNTIVGNSTGALACFGFAVPQTTPTRFTITSLGHNIDTANSCGFASAGDKINIGPSSLFVGGLALNDGFSLNYAIQAGSPAHDQGDNANCPEIDQRNYTRDASCDIGAYEISSTRFAGELADLQVGVTGNTATQGGGGSVIFTVTVTNKGPNTANNVKLTGKLPPWGMPQPSAVTTNNGGTCSLTATGFLCELGTLNPFVSAQVYVVIFPQQEGNLVIEVEAVSDQVDTFRPDSISSLSIPAVPGTGTGTDPRGIGDGFSGKGGSVDWSWALLLLVPVLRHCARRRT